MQVWYQENQSELPALNDLEVKTSHIQNAYLTAPCSERYILHLGQSLEKRKGR